MKGSVRWMGGAVAAVLLLVLALGQVRAQAPATGAIRIVQGGTGQGTITSNPAGIDCTLGFSDPSGTCEASFPAGTKVKLIADAAPSSKFVGWAPVNSCPKPKNLTVEAGRVMHSETILKGMGRVRDVAAGPDGAVYVVLNRPGTVVRLTPIRERY